MVWPSLSLCALLFVLLPNRFAVYNVGGAVLWTVLFLGAGFFFGNLPGGHLRFNIDMSSIAP